MKLSLNSPASTAYESADFTVRKSRLTVVHRTSFIRLAYATPIELRLPRREILISEAVFLIRNTDFLDQPVLHHDGRTTLVFKCDGTDMLRLMCMPALAAHFPPGYQGNCLIVRER